MTKKVEKKQEETDDRFYIFEEMRTLRIDNCFVECGCIAHKIWAEKKETVVPWGFMRAFNPIKRDEVSNKIPIRYFQCVICAHIFVVNKPGPEYLKGSIQRSMKAHLNVHFPYLIDDEVKGKTSTSIANIDRKYEITVNLLKSGLPFFQFTTKCEWRTFLSEQGVEEISRTTFRK